MKVLKGSRWQAGKRYFHNSVISSSVKGILSKGLLLAGVLASSAALASSSAVAPAFGQSIRADDTLSTTVSSPDSKRFTIEDGDRIGDNLFHSFEEFSIPTGGSAIFANPADVLNIISRVSENNPSDINGLIQANGLANLFLINPAGIVLGPNAQLNVGGSFIGSTAESVRFDDGTEFSAIAPNPLLTISAPTGLQLGATSREIEVSDTGYRILKARPLTLDSSSSLTVRPGNTLALVGNGITLTGATLASPGGRVALGSVAEGIVSLQSAPLQVAPWTLGFDNVQTFSPLTLSDQALINTSDLLFDASGNRILVDPFFNLAVGPQGGHIRLQGSHIALEGGSLALVQNYTGSQTFGDIEISASDTVELSGAEASGQIESGLATTSFGAAQGGDITIKTRQLSFAGGATVTTETFGPATGGRVRVTAAEDISFARSGSQKLESGGILSASYVNGASGDIEINTPKLVIAESGIAAQSIGSGAGGAVYVNADQLTLTDGGNVASATLGSGLGGAVTVISDTLNIVGVDRETFFPSSITAATTGTGNAGNVTVQARQIFLREGGRIDASSLNAGDAGTVTINATERLEVSGTVPNSINPSIISSAANELDPELRQFFASQDIFVPQIPTGNAGDVIIDTPILAVSSGAEVTVRNDGPGNAGLLTVNADRIEITENAGITASTQAGSGGNILLNVRDVMLMRQGSELSADAGNAGNGGNITLTIPVVIALENSDIIANAVEGNGGNIQISTQGLIGTEFRNARTAESDITANSQFGASGVVDISTLEVDPSVGVVALPTAVADSSDQIVAGCANAQSSQFIATGRGGIPLNPRSVTDITSLWTDVRSPLLAGHTAAFEVLSPEPSVSIHPMIDSPTVAARLSENGLTTATVEATAWRRNHTGEITLASPIPTTIVAATAPLSCLRDSLG